MDYIDKCRNLADQLVETGLFSYGSTYLTLVGTKFRYSTYYLTWNEFGMYGYIRNLTTEEVLNNIDQETQTQLLFHLDLFR